ncbi:hypothetical protein CISG_03964 [Coccidioides immitis RMSCC 3703]|uniref:Yeast cell wall synthesis Kre9/Knh1-like N-terminal domain-containing protein n=2 Tax=Coccidioides immitis TaxID=5501 RepID=A0A0J8QNF7_COCIT|nr:hypothetical protein CIRG_03140 [Coccidioides immitis RMSCC 2394]KMU73986.1 hypothetical protein CISG_03964 [Coccidioides immitis RMSCC 3703]
MAEAPHAERVCSFRCPFLLILFNAPSRDCPAPARLLALFELPESLVAVHKVIRVFKFKSFNMRFLPIIFSVLAPLAAAIEITNPESNTPVAAGQDVKVTWTFVDTDPHTLSLYLVNFVEYPPTYVPLAIDVKTHKAHHEVHVPCDTMPAHGYQINAINGTNVYVIYAQSEHFKVSEHRGKGDCGHDDRQDDDKREDGKPDDDKRDGDKHGDGNPDGRKDDDKRNDGKQGHEKPDGRQHDDKQDDENRGGGRKDDGSRG